jgi:hypothetical protein
MQPTALEKEANIDLGSGAPRRFETGEASLGCDALGDEWEKQAMQL